MAPATLRTAAWIVGCLGGRWPPRHTDALKLAGRLEHRRLRQGQTAFAQGALPDGVWIVHSGELELVAGRGRNRVVVGTLQSCGIAGDVPLLLRRPAVCTVRARTDAQAGFLAEGGFLAVLDTSPALARACLTGLARRHLRAQEAQSRPLHGSAESRVAWLLLHEARNSTVSCSQDTLAAMLGMRRQAMNRIIKDFERQGTVAGGLLPTRTIGHRLPAPSCAGRRLRRHTKAPGHPKGGRGAPGLPHVRTLGAGCGRAPKRELAIRTPMTHGGHCAAPEGSSGTRIRCQRDTQRHEPAAEQL